MKTSNKIFITFLIFLFSGIIILYIGSKYYVENYDPHNFVHQEKLLPPFSVVVAENNASIHLQNGSKRKIFQSFFKTAQPKFAPFLVRNDTLFVFSVKKDRNKEPRATFQVGIYCDNIKHVVAKDGALVNFSKYKVDSIFVKMKNADLFCDNNSSNHIKLIANNSRANFDCLRLNSMEVELEKTELDLKSKNRVTHISGSVKNDSQVKLFIDGKINLYVDRSSYFAMFDF